MKFFGAPTFLCRAPSGPTWKQLVENRMCEKGGLPVAPTWQEGKGLVTQYVRGGPTLPGSSRGGGGETESVALGSL